MGASRDQSMMCSSSVEEGGRPPVHVVEDRHQWTAAGQALEQPAERPEGLFTTGGGSSVRLFQTDGGCHAIGHDLRLGQSLRKSSESLERCLARIVGMDAGRRAQGLGQGPVADGVAI